MWQVNSDSTKLDGTWDFSGDTDFSGTWNLNRIYYTSEMPDIAASIIKGELISDQTPVEVMVGDIEVMNIKKPDVVETTKKVAAWTLGAILALLWFLVQAAASL